MMTDWYYHEPGQGRIGPLTADDLRKRFRERRIATDTLVWRDGLREWQPLEQLREELELLGVVPDASMPPPLPAQAPLRMTEARAPHPAARSAGSATARTTASAPPPSNKRGCLIAAIVIGVLGLLMIAILAAIALPAYQDYVKRSKALQAGQTPQYEFDGAALALNDRKVRSLLSEAMTAHYRKNGYCPDEFEFEQLWVRYERWIGPYTVAIAGEVANGCEYDVSFLQLGPNVDGKPLRYTATILGDKVEVHCSNNLLAPEFAPPDCSTGAHQSTPPNH